VSDTIPATSTPLPSRPTAKRSVWSNLGASVGGSSLKTDYGAELALFKTWTSRVAVVIAFVLVVFLPQIFGPFAMNVTTIIFLTLPGAIALNLLQGVAGQVSAGNAAFLGIGAIVTCFLVYKWPTINFLVVLPIAGLVAGTVGAFVALPALRVRGLYLLISTLALHFIIVYLILVYQIRTVGEAGWTIPSPSIPGIFTIGKPITWYYFLGFFALLAMMVMANIMRTRVGRAWIAVRDGDIAAEIVGVNVMRAKIDAFVISSFIIGVQGALFAYYTVVVQNTLFTFDLAILYISIVIIGGMGSTFGTLLGTTMVIGFPYFLQVLAAQLPPDSAVAHALVLHIFDIQNIGYGLMIMGFLLFAPYGLVQLWRRAFSVFTLWPFSKERSAR
jgi:branched-chain amino acid transport system permease protein